MGGDAKIPKNAFKGETENTANLFSLGFLYEQEKIQNKKEQKERDGIKLHAPSNDAGQDKGEKKKC